MGNNCHDEVKNYTMRNSSNGLIISLLFAAVVGFISLYLFQSVWLKLILQRLNATPSSGFPVSSTPISGFSFPTKSAPASLGKELKIGNLGITVTSVIRPADRIVESADKTNIIPEKDKEYLMVNIKTRCISKSETCRLTEFDFGVHSQSGQDYTAELSGNFTNIKGVFEEGDIKPGQSLSGSIFFMIGKVERGLKLIYPRLYNFGASAEFLLGQ